MMWSPNFVFSLAVVTIETPRATAFAEVVLSLVHGGLAVAQAKSNALP